MKHCDLAIAHWVPDSEQSPDGTGLSTYQLPPLHELKGSLVSKLRKAHGKELLPSSRSSYSDVVAKSSALHRRLLS